MAAADLQTMRRLTCAACSARDGRGVWRERVRAEVDMIRRGTTPTIARTTADACEAIGQGMRARILAAGFKP